MRHWTTAVPPITSSGTVIDVEEHADPPSDRRAWTSLALLLVALVAVVGNAKAVSPTIESAVEAAAMPLAVVGVVIALLVLALTVGVGTLTLVPGRATPLQGGVHLAIFAAFLFLAVSP